MTASMRCISFRELERGSLRGFADLELQSGLIIRDCTLHESHGKRWVSPPAKPMVDADRRLVLKDGKVQYAALIDFRDKATRDRFSEAAIDAIDAYIRMYDCRHVGGRASHAVAR